jgi:hypothetical protein
MSCSLANLEAALWALRQISSIDGEFEGTEPDRPSAATRQWIRRCALGRQWELLRPLVDAGAEVRWASIVCGAAPLRACATCFVE